MLRGLSVFRSDNQSTIDLGVNGTMKVELVGTQ